MVIIYTIYNYNYQPIRSTEVRLVNTQKLSDYNQMYIKRTEVKEIKRKV